MNQESKPPRSASDLKTYARVLYEIFLHRTAGDWRRCAISVCVVVALAPFAPSDQDGSSLTWRSFLPALLALAVALVLEMALLGYRAWKQERQRALEPISAVVQASSVQVRPPSELELMLERLERMRFAVLDGMNGAEFLRKVADRMRSDPPPDKETLLLYASPRRLTYDKRLPGHVEFARLINELVEADLMRMDPGSYQYRLTERGRTVLALMEHRNPSGQPGSATP